MVFTSSPEITQLARYYNLTIIKSVLRNSYGMPFIRSIFQIMKGKISAMFYGYINSDILIHPRVFELLPIISTKMKNGILPSRVELISRVKMTDIQILEKDFSSLDRVYNVFNKTRESELRSELSIVLFIIFSIIHRMFSFSHPLFLSTEFLL